MTRPESRHSGGRVHLGTIGREWARMGATGFGGPPTHLSLLRRLCVEDRDWIPARDFEDGVAATNLLPGPASTQMAIFCAWRLRGVAGAVIGGAGFILPGLILILGLSAVFLSGHPPTWILGFAAGAGAAVPAVAVSAAAGFVPASWARMGSARDAHLRWIAYALVGGAAAATVGTYLVLALVACGLVEVAIRRAWRPPGGTSAKGVALAVVGHGAGAGGLGALVWVAFKVGALSYGGGFVIIPLMQHDAVSGYHWLSGAQFLNAVALGQVTPGPVVLTVAVVGYAAGGLAGGVVAAAIAFAPSFLFVIFGGPQFDRIRANASIQTFLTGAGPSVIGAIAGSAIPLAGDLHHLWQIGMLAIAAIWLLALRKGVVLAILAAGAIGIIAAIAGAPVTR